MKRLRVESSAVVSVGYDPESEILEVEFHSGDVWHYHRVPVKDYYAMITSESIGKYFSTRIKGRHPETQVK